MKSNVLTLRFLGKSSGSGDPAHKSITPGGHSEQRCGHYLCRGSQVSGSAHTAGWTLKR